MAIAVSNILVLRVFPGNSCCICKRTVVDVILGQHIRCGESSVVHSSRCQGGNRSARHRNKQVIENDIRQGYIPGICHRKRV